MSGKGPQGISSPSCNSSFISPTKRHWLEKKVRQTVLTFATSDGKMVDVLYSVAEHCPLLDLELTKRHIDREHSKTIHLRNINSVTLEKALTIAVASYQDELDGCDAGDDETAADIEEEDPEDDPDEDWSNDEAEDAAEKGNDDSGLGRADEEEEFSVDFVIYILEGKRPPEKNVLVSWMPGRQGQTYPPSRVSLVSIEGGEKSRLIRRYRRHHAAYTSWSRQMRPLAIKPYLEELLSDKLNSLPPSVRVDPILVKHLLTTVQLILSTGREQLEDEYRLSWSYYYIYVFDRYLGKLADGEGGCMRQGCRKHFHSKTLENVLQILITQQYPLDFIEE